MKKKKKLPNICQTDEATRSKCSINGKLMCKLDKWDSIKFGVPFWISVIIYFIGLGFGFRSGTIDLVWLIIYIVIFLGLCKVS